MTPEIESLIRRIEADPRFIEAEKQADVELEVWEACLDAGCNPEWVLDALWGPPLDMAELRRKHGRRREGDRP